ncbi:MAG: hypothetical protein DMF84_11495 [Acidobacteria bacterium]|nr:MAG: hypothetical protein DMF84_11495 [Acidobacteriota bacterium]
MSRMSCRAIALFVVLLTIPIRAYGQFATFQHGARGTAEAGALTARAADASSVFYNPAALIQLENVQIQIGCGVDLLHADYARDDLRAFSSDSNLPASAFLAFHPVGAAIAVGVGIDSPVGFRHTDVTDASVGPGFELDPDFEAHFREVHPVVAVRLGARWSVGGGVRYLRGWLRDDYDTVLDSGRNPNTFFVLGARSARAETDGWSADAAIAFRDRVWGFGAVASRGAALNGIARIDLTVRHFGLPGAPRAGTSAAYLLEDAPRGLGIDVPPEYRAGIWAAPHRRMRLEGDVAFIQWAQAGWYRPREQPLCGAPCSTLLRRDWRNTISPRIGMDIDVAEHLQVIGGVAFDTSPLRAGPGGASLTPDQPAALSTYAGGITYDFAHVSLDAGYSFHRAGRSQDVSGGQLSSNSHVWAVSIRWRLPWAT